MLTRSRITVIMSVALVCLFCCSKNVFAQTTNAKGEAVVTLGNITGGNTTMDAILAQPKLTASQGFVVIGYKVSFLTNDKTEKTGQAYFGPYTVKGAELSQQIKDYMKKYEHSKSKVMIEDIQVMGMGHVVKGAPVILSYSGKP